MRREFSDFLELRDFSQYESAWGGGRSAHARTGSVRVAAAEAWGSYAVEPGFNPGLPPSLDFAPSLEPAPDAFPIEPIDPVAAAAFTPGNIVVYRVGAVGGGALTSAATAVFLDEYTITGTLVQSIALPTADNGAQQILTQSGSATSGGPLDRSSDGRFLLLTGYDAAVGTAGVTGTSTATVNRIVGRLDASGTVDTSTVLNTAFNADNVRGATSVDGSTIYVVGNGSSSASSGTWSIGFGTTGGTQIVSGNFRAADIVDGNVVVDSASVISRFAGLPTSAATPTSLGLALTNANEFVFLDRAAGVGDASLGGTVDTLYVGQDANLAKFFWNGTAWTAAGTATGFGGVRGLDGLVSGSNALLYATNAAGTALFSLTDTAAYNATITSTFTVLANASTNTVFRGLAFAPQNPLENQIVSISLVQATQNEGNAGNTTYTFTVSRTGGTTGALAFTAGFNAIDTNAADFGGVLPGTVSSSIAAGQASTTFTVNVSGDTTFEPNETFSYALTGQSNPGAASVTVGTATATATITNDDAAPPSENQVVNFLVNTLLRTEGSGGGATAYVFTVIREGGTTGQLDFSVGFTALTTNAADFVGGALPSGFSGSILPGQSTATITVNVAADTIVETNESFRVTVTGVTNAAAASATLGNANNALGLIDNDDAYAGATVIGGTNVLAAGASLQGSASVPVAGNGIGLVRLGATPGTGATAAGRAESLTYDPATGRVYVTNVAGSNDLVDVFQINADGSLTQLAGINLGSLAQIGTVNSVAVKNGIVAVAYDNVTVGQPGRVALYDTATLTLQKLITVGVLPDQLTFTPDGTKLLVANEAEAVSAGVNPGGSVFIIDVSAGAASATLLSRIFFDRLGGSETALRGLGIPIFGSESAEEDIEPEYISVSADGTRAYVTLQEVNAVAVIDLTNPTADAPLAILPLGFIDRSLAGNQFDASDGGGGGGGAAINLINAPVFSALQPDAIATFVIGGETYFITANEGDSRVGGLTDEARLSTRDLDDALFPNEAVLKQNANLGRLNVLTDYGDTDNDGDLDQIYTFGGRGFSIFKQNADGTITKVRESGGEFERIIAANYAGIHNIDHSGTAPDDRSDNKGPEPEGVTIGVVGGRTYAFIALERVGGVIVYDVTDPANAFYVGYTPRNAADAGPETILFIAAADNPTGQALVLTANEISGTTTVYRVAPSVNGSTIQNGSTANDSFTGTPNDDVFFLQQGGNDTATGAGGNDGFFFGAAYTIADSVDGGAGVYDQIGLQGDYSGGVTLGNLVGTELVVLLPGNDARFGGQTGTNLSYNITANGSTMVSNNRLTIQANTLRAGESFTFNGAASAIDFLIYASLGTDTLTGGSGNDGFFFGNARFGATDVVNGGAGTLDQLGLQGDFSGANAITFGAAQLSGLEFIVLLSAGDNRFGSSGGIVAYELTMIDANVAAGAILIISANTLQPSEFLAFNGSAELDGSFRIFSGACNDFLRGSQIADEIFGGAGSDIIFGNGGGDQLTGGAGPDTFAYAQLLDSTSAAPDSILDFQSGDTIDLALLAANTGVAGGTFQYIGGAAQSGARQLQVLQTGTAATVNVFIDADAVADLVINLTVAAGYTLTEADFTGDSPNSDVVPLAAALSMSDIYAAGLVKQASDGFLSMAFLRDFGGPDIVSLMRDFDLTGGTHDLLV